jgi:hypothetical protein
MDQTDHITSNNDSIFIRLLGRNQSAAIEEILKRLAPRDLAALSATSKAIHEIVLQFCAQQPWFAPGPRTEPCPRYGAYRRYEPLATRWAPFLLNLATLCAVLTWVSALWGRELVRWGGGDTSWAQLWQRLSLSAPPLPRGPLAKLKQLLWEFAGLGPLLMGVPPTTLFAGSYSYLSRCWPDKQMEELWVLESHGLPRGQQPSFLELDNRLDWERVNRLACLSERVTGKAKFLHRRRQELYGRQQGHASPDRQYLHPLYRRYVELHFNLEFDEACCFQGQQPVERNPAARTWKQRIAALEHEGLQRHWSRQHLVNRRIDPSQYGSYRAWYNRHQGGISRDWWLSMYMAVGMAWFPTLLVPGVNGFLWVSSRLEQLLRFFKVTGNYVSLMASAGTAILEGVAYGALSSYVRRTEWARIATSLKARYVERHRPEDQYPQVDFKTLPLHTLDETVDWQRVNHYALMEPNLLQMAAAWSAELQEARNQNPTPGQLQYVVDRIDQEFAHARLLLTGSLPAEIEAS